jgi:hypothetical protein
MSVVFFSLKSENEGCQYLDLARSTLPDKKFRSFRTAAGLEGYLKNFPSPKLAILLAADHEELAALASLKKRLGGTKVILLLPDRQKASLDLAAALSPLLACFLDDGFSDVAAVLARMRRESLEQRDALDPKRYRWGGVVPYVVTEGSIEDMEPPAYGGEASPLA